MGIQPDNFGQTLPAEGPGAPHFARSGNLTKRPRGLTRYLTRQWAEGPANLCVMYYYVSVRGGSAKEGPRLSSVFCRKMILGQTGRQSFLGAQATVAHTTSPNCIPNPRVTFISAREVNFIQNTRVNLEVNFK